MPALWGTGPTDSRAAPAARVDLPGHGLRAWDTRIRDLGGARARGLRPGPARGDRARLVAGRNDRARACPAASVDPRRPRPDSDDTALRRRRGLAARHRAGVLESLRERLRRDYRRTVQRFPRAAGAGRHADPQRDTAHAAGGRVQPPAHPIREPSRPASTSCAVRTCARRCRDIELATLVITGEHDRLAHPPPASFLPRRCPGGGGSGSPAPGTRRFCRIRWPCADEVAAFLDRLRLPAARPAMAAG